MRTFLVATLAVAASAIKVNESSQPEALVLAETEASVMDTSTVYFDGQSTAEVARTLLGDFSMLKDASAIESFIREATGEEGYGFLSEDQSRLESMRAELDQIAKEYEQTSRRLIHMYAKIAGQEYRVSESTLAEIMMAAGVSNLSDAAVKEFGSHDDDGIESFTTSEFMTFLEAVDADPEEEHPDFAIVRDIAAEAESILGLTTEILGTTATIDESGPSDTDMTDDAAMMG